MMQETISQNRWLNDYLTFQQPTNHGPLLCSLSGSEDGIFTDPDSKIYGADMGPIWGGQDPGGPPCWPHELFYLGRTIVIPWVLRHWLLASPDHRRPWYWLCEMGRALSLVVKDFCDVSMRRSCLMTYKSFLTINSILNRLAKLFKRALQWRHLEIKASQITESCMFRPTSSQLLIIGLLWGVSMGDWWFP